MPEAVPNLVELAQGKQPVIEAPKNNSAYNAMKHGRYAKLPALCDKCHYRSKEAGGTGKCPEYQAGSVCVIREDIKKVAAQYNTRDPSQLKDLTQDIIHILYERVAFAEFTAKLDGNLLDKSTLAQVNALHKYIQLQSSLGTVTIEATEKTTDKTAKESIREVLRSFKVSDQVG